MKTIIVGDVHGCLRELKELLSLIPFDQSQDRLLFVGDLINKGPFSYEVLKYVREELRAEVVVGNHEVKFLKGMGDSLKLPPVLRELKQKMEEEGCLKEWICWIKNLPLFIEAEDFLVVHAGLSPHQKPKDTSCRILTCLRTWDGKGEDLNDPKNPPWFHFYKGKKLVVFGHWAKKGLIERNNVIGLDSGCVYGKKLSALILPEKKVLSISAKKAYCPLKDNK